MSPEDTALFEQAKEWYNAGHHQKAYEQFCEIHHHGNTENVSLLCWLGYSTPKLKEARRALADVERLRPNHPSLPKLRSRVNQLQQKGALVAAWNSGPKTPKMTCPYCGKAGPAHIRSKVSTGGWITLIVLLFLFFPICWIGLLIKKDTYVCGYCGIELGDVRY